MIHSLSKIDVFIKMINLFSKTDDVIKNDKFIQWNRWFYKKMINLFSKTDDLIKMINLFSKTDDFIKMINLFSKTDDFTKKWWIYLIQHMIFKKHDKFANKNGKV